MGRLLLASGLILLHKTHNKLLYCPNSAVLGSTPSIGHRRGRVGLVDLKVIAYDNLRS